MATAYAASGVRTHFLQTDLARLRSPAAFARARRGFTAICEDVQPDIIHSHFVGTTLFLRLAFPRGNGALRVFQVAGPLHLENAMTRAADLMTARDCDYWIATCKATRDIYRDVGVPADRVGLTYLGMDIGKFTAVPPSLSRESLNLPPTTRLVGLIAYYYAPKRWLGYRRGIKGHEDLIEATGILRDKGLDVAAVFAGGPWPGAEDYAASVAARGRERLGSRAVFLGRVADVRSVYASLDLAVHPSLSENVGGSCESLVLNVPTVATRVGGIPDVVIDGDTGWLAEPGNPRSLAAKIEAALSDPQEAKRRAENGRRLVSTLLDVTRNGQEVHDFYRQIMSGRGRTPETVALAEGAKA
jgi:glycosyltransferase involved in cell wall biosynthesis